MDGAKTDTSCLRAGLTYGAVKVCVVSQVPYDSSALHGVAEDNQTGTGNPVAAMIHSGRM